ncbi:ABC transporter permease subunit [Kineococcus sp. R8]|uniref:ABC transporter permease n=1 Tax=Kineococcus siccus TaxID=2696567 RepID=UPI00141354E1|nr:ABC transporter permease [Kineococcus siccus]NAZ83068.1 ABC transporter permease subunit [Kineococcus siccus]
MLRRLRAPHGALALPAWVFLLTFFVAPVALVVWYSFGEKPGLFGTHSNEVLSFARYAEAADATFLATFWNTLRIAVLGTLICLVVALPFAYWVAVKVPARWRGLLIALVLVPFWTNFLVRTLGWQIALSPEGPASSALQALGLRDGPLQVLYTRGAVQLGVVYNYLPLMVLPCYVALERTTSSLREASRDLGAGRWRTLTSVTLPLAFPGIAAGCLLVFVPLMGDYVTATVLGGAKGNMVGQLVASQFQTAQNWALGSAMAVLLVAFIAGTVLVAAVVALLVRGAVRRARRVDLPAPAGEPSVLAGAGARS